MEMRVDDNVSDYDNLTFGSDDTSTTTTSTMTHIFTQIITGVLAVMIPLTVLGNLATIAAFIKVRALREKPSDLFILSLSSADLGVGFVLLMIFPTNIIGYWPWGEFGCKFYIFVANTFVFGGVVNTTFISFDRYLLISQEYPKYMKIQSRKHVLRTILVVWLYSLSLGALEVSLWDIIEVPGMGKRKFDYSRECRSPPKHNFTYAISLFMANFFAPMIIIEFLSVVFVILLRRKLKKRAQVGFQEHDFSQQSDDPNRTEVVAVSSIRSHAPVATVPNSNHNPQNTAGGERASTGNRYTKAAVTLGALVVALNFCLPPYVLYSLTVSFFCLRCNNPLVRDSLVYLIYLNSCINPVLYAATMSKIRKFYKDVVKKCYHRIR